jgi:hypothetical protein
MTVALHKLFRAGVLLNDEVLRCLSPYLTEHINRFGDYRLDLTRQPPQLDFSLPIIAMGANGGG